MKVCSGTTYTFNHSYFKGVIFFDKQGNEISRKYFRASQNLSALSFKTPELCNAIKFTNRSFYPSKGIPRWIGIEYQ